MPKRPPIDKDIKNKVLVAVRGGESVRSAAKRYGVSVNTVYSWVHRARPAEARAEGTLAPLAPDLAPLAPDLASAPQVEPEDVTPSRLADNDLRVRVLLAIKGGERACDAAKRFGVNPRTVYNWIRRHAPEIGLRARRARELKQGLAPPPDGEVVFSGPLEAIEDPRERAFVIYYTGKAAGSASSAARMAGFDWPESRLRARALTLRRRPDIDHAVAVLVKLRAMSKGEVLASMSSDASASMGDFIEVDKLGSVRFDLAKASARGRLHHIKKLKVKQGVTRGPDGEPEPWQEVTFELVDSQRAKIEIAKMHGMYRPKDDKASKGAPVMSVEQWQESRQMAQERLKAFRSGLASGMESAQDDDDLTGS